MNKYEIAYGVRIRYFRVLMKLELMEETHQYWPRVTMGVWDGDL